MKITGYGRGWQEPKATSRWKRALQIMREPAGWTTYIVLGCAFLLYIQQRSS